MNLAGLLGISEDIANYLGVDYQVFRSYLEEDNHTGYPDAVPGSIWKVDGQILYAVARAINAMKIADIGTFGGISATHFAAAMALVNGKVTSVDIWQRHGDFIPDELRRYVELVHNDGETFLRHHTDEFDIVSEDTDHVYDTARKIAMAGRSALRPGGVYIVHDVCHVPEGVDVLRAVKDAGMDPFVIQVQGTDSGLGFWKKP